MLLIVPAFHLSPATGPVILGFGDVLLPGLLGVYSRTFDLYHNLDIWQSYFWPTVVGYAVGLMLTYIALWFEIGGSQGQPALLYLIPCTLGLTLLLAMSRKHLTLMCSNNAFAMYGLVTVCQILRRMLSFKILVTLICLHAHVEYSLLL